VEISNTPLAIKLGVTGTSRVLVLHAPAGFELDVDPRVVQRRRSKSARDVVVAFFTQDSTYRDEIESLSRLITPSGGLWIVWPKRSSGVTTTMTDHIVRDGALPLGLVDNKVCAIDATWTGVRLVWRLERRAGLTNNV
jgi:hypothetical protein